jgi:hypothetical protein
MQMKKIALSLLLMLILLACSMSDLSPTPLPANTATPLLPTNTATANIPPTYTFTPTFIGGRPSFTPTETPPPSSTFLLVTLPTGTPEPTEPGEIVPTETLSGLEGSGFESVEVTETEFHWGSCNPNKSTMTVKVADPGQVLSVVVFVRFRNKSSGGVTGWDDGTAMENKGGGIFTFVFDGNLMGTYYNSFVVYQLVGTDATGANVARSPVFPEALSLSACP